MDFRLYQCTILLLALITIGACSDNGSGPDPEPEIITKTLVAKDDAGNEVTGLTVANGDDTLAENVSEYNAKAKKDATKTYTLSAAGYSPQTKSVTFNADGMVTFTLSEDNPETVTISLQVVNDADAPTAADVVYQRDGQADSTVAEDVTEADIQLPYSEAAGQLCASAAYHQSDCKTITPTQNETLTFTLAREMISYDVDVRDSDSDELVDNPKRSASGGSWKAVTAANMTFPARDGQRKIRFTAAGYDTVEASFAADEDQSKTIKLTAVPECSDGIDNDGDGNIDEADTGCVDENGNYDPEDPNELLKGRQRIGSSAAESTYLVSGAEGDRIFELIPSYVSAMPKTIQASVRITLEVSVLVSENQPEEEWALELKTGPTDDQLETAYISDIITDDGTDGWKTVTFEIPTDVFDRGLELAVTAKHATEIRGEPFSDGNDDVIFFTSEKSPDTVWTWFYEPEEVE